MRTRVALAAATLSLAALLPAPALAQDPPFKALSDTREVPTEAEALVELDALRSSVCQRGRRGSTRRMSKRAALGRATRVLQQRVPRRAYNRFVRSRRAKRAATAEDLAAAAFADKSPGTALAGFLAATRREPRNPRHLVNAATILVRLGKAHGPSLITAAERLRRPRRMPMGIGFRPLALNARGFALIALRRYAEAERVLRRAVSAEPLLAEAKLNLAAALLCRGRVAQAVGPYVAGQRRRALPGGVEAARLQPSAAAALDLSKGRAGSLPPLQLPATPDDGVASAAAWKAAEAARYAEADRLYQQANSTLVAYSNGLAGKPQLQQRRSGEILGMFNARYNQRPDLRALRDAIFAADQQFKDLHLAWQQEYDQLRTDCQNAGGTSDEVGACIRSRCIPVTNNAHARWLELIRTVEGNTRQWAAELYRYATGIASNYANPQGRAAVLAAVRHEIATIYASRVVLEISSRTGVEDLMKEDCVASAGAPAAETGENDFPTPDLCPPALAAVKISFSIGFADFGVNCEEIEVEAKLPGAFGPFAQVQYGIASGSTTVFAGARAGGRFQGLVGAGAKAGVYMSFDSSGNPTDCGLRGQAGVSLPGLPGLPGTAPRLGGQLDYSLADTFL